MPTFACLFVPDYCPSPPLPKKNSLTWRWNKKNSKRRQIYTTIISKQSFDIIYTLFRITASVSYRLRFGLVPLKPSGQPLTLKTSKQNHFSAVYLCSKNVTNRHTRIFNNIETEIGYHSFFLQNHSFSFISASFTLTLEREDVQQFYQIGRFSPPYWATFWGRSGRLPDWAFFPTLLGYF